MANGTGLSTEQVSRFVNSIMNLGTSTAEQGLRKTSAKSGIGVFSISKRAARTGRNPQTGKEIKIAAKNVVRFKAGADLSKKVN
ncbi:HU family DNA-binding protein [Pseudomonadota bacterium]